MKKIAGVYWSGTGNTQAMAEAIAAAAQADLFEAPAFDASQVDGYDAIAFGCPAMGAEQLEESEFEPMFSACLPALRGKKIALFGSYGWGDGEWMQTWEKECAEAGAVFAAESLLCHEAPDGEALDSCKALGRALAEA